MAYVLSVMSFDLRLTSRMERDWHRDKERKAQDRDPVLPQWPYGSPLKPLWDSVAPNLDAAASAAVEGEAAPVPASRLGSSIT